MLKLAHSTQVDGLSSLSGQVASLSGTIGGLQAGIAAAASSSELTVFFLLLHLCKLMLTQFKLL